MEQTMKKAIDNKNIVIIKFLSKEKGIITRTCIPYDIGPSRRDKIKVTKFHFKTLDSPEENHTLLIEPRNIIDLVITNEKFKPEDHITWDIIEWHYPRDWGEFS